MEIKVPVNTKTNVIEYQFNCGITAVQKPLTVVEGRKIWGLLKQVKLDNINETKLIDLIDKLVEEGVLGDILPVILKTSAPVNWDELELNEAAEVAADFFTLNKKLMSLFMIGSGVPAGS